MRLVYRIVLHMSWALSLLLAGWAVLFYLTMIDEINDEVDDSLENYAEMLVTRSLAGRELPAAYSGSNNGYYLHDVSAEYAEGRQHMVFSDEEIFIPEKDEEEPARVLRTIFRDSGGRYKELTVMTPTIEKDDLQEAILWWIVYLYLFLLLAILLVNVLVLHRTLRPLYALLRWQLYRGREERPAGERYEGRRIPAAERGGEPLCRAGGVPVRTPETIYRQCLA